MWVVAEDVYKPLVPLMTNYWSRQKLTIRVNDINLWTTLKNFCSRAIKLLGSELVQHNIQWINENLQVQLLLPYVHRNVLLMRSPVSKKWINKSLTRIPSHIDFGNSSDDDCTSTCDTCKAKVLMWTALHMYTTWNIYLILSSIQFKI